MGQAFILLDIEETVVGCHIQNAVAGKGLFEFGTMIIPVRPPNQKFFWHFAERDVEQIHLEGIDGDLVAGLFLTLVDFTLIMHQIVYQFNHRHAA